MRWILVLVLLAAAHAYAADGDFVESIETGDGVLDVFKLCDGAPDGVCEAFDITVRQHVAGNANSKATARRPTLPNAIAFTFNLATGCSGATTVMPMGSDFSNLSPWADLASAAMDKPAAGETDQVVVGSFQPGNRYVSADIQTLTACTDVEVWIKLFYYR